MPQTEKPALASEERGGAPTKKQQNGYGRHLAVKKTMRNLLALAILGCVLFWGTGLAMADQQNDGSSVEQATEASIQIPFDRLTGIETLLLKNAVAALWGKGNITEPGREVNFDALSAPEHVFVELVSLVKDNETWGFEGMVRSMAPRKDGIEAIAARELFNMRFRKLGKSNFYIDELKFEPLPEME